MSKLITLAVGAGAYVLGAKAGRARYDQISDRASTIWHDPRVQQKTAEASEKVKQTAVKAKRAHSKPGDETDSDDLAPSGESSPSVPSVNAGHTVQEHEPAQAVAPR